MDFQPVIWKRKWNEVRLDSGAFFYEMGLRDVNYDE